MQLKLWANKFQGAQSVEGSTIEETHGDEVVSSPMLAVAEGGAASQPVSVFQL